MTNPTTSPDGLPYQTLDGPDEPIDTLNGGSSGTVPILAVKTQEALTDIRGDVQDVDSRLTAVEDQGVPSWVRIAENIESSPGATFVIPSIPTGQFSRVRLTMHGSVTNAGNIRVRVNADGALLHLYGILVYDALGNLDANDWADDSGFWQVAHWGTAISSAFVEMVPTDTSNQIRFKGEGIRIGGIASTTERSFAWGRIQEARLLDSLRVSGPAGEEFSGDVRWSLEGAPA